MIRLPFGFVIASLGDLESARVDGLQTGADIARRAASAEYDRGYAQGRGDMYVKLTEDIPARRAAGRRSTLCDGLRATGRCALANTGSMDRCECGSLAYATAQLRNRGES